jgi:hypothetical protein
MALVLVILAVIVILGAITVVVNRVQTAKLRTDHAVTQTRLDEVCKAGVDLAVERLWNQYVTGNGNTTGNLASYLVFLDGFIPNNEDVNGNGTQDGDEWDMNGDGNFEVNDPVTFVSSEANRVLESGEQIQLVTLSRTDDLTGSTITVRSTGRVGVETKTMVQTVRTAGQLFRGFEYGVLANNINCIMCHAKVIPLDLFRNAGNPAAYGTFDRVKVAALESLMIRTSEDIGTRFAGTTYTRGSVYNQTGSLMNGTAIAGSTFKGYHFSSTNGKVTQDSSGNMTTTNLSNATNGTNGKLNQFANLYLNYPTDDTLMTDGDLPTNFPAPFPDDDGDRNVSGTEFDKVIYSANGSISFQLDPSEVTGTVQAGVAYGVPAGATYSGTSLPTASNSAIDQLSQDGTYDGNLILIGTVDDPIVIDKKVAVNGDLIIKGKVKGWGQIYTKGNVYVAGDVTYDDAPGEFGIADDGTKNGFALTAGGSIMIGDYLTIRAKDHNSDTGKFPGGGYIDVRTPNKNQTISKSGVNQTVAIGYFDSGVVDAGVAQGTQTEYSFTTSELMLFNQMEYKKKLADSSFKPRYYRIRPTQPLYRYTANDEHAVKYDDAGVSTITNPGDATIHDLNPKDYWVSESQLRNFWYADEMSRPSSGRAWQFDGLLYSNNSIFCVTRSSDRHKSNTRGQMVVRGSIVTADLGVLVPGPDFSVPRTAFNLYYDRRVADFLRVEDTTRVQFTRLTTWFE